MVERVCLRGGAHFRNALLNKPVGSRTELIVMGKSGPA